MDVIEKSNVLSLSSYVTAIPVSVLLPTIAPTVSEIYSLRAVPSTVIASASSVPSISASPEISKVAASNSPVAVIFLNPEASLLASTCTTSETPTVPAVAGDLAIGNPPAVEPLCTTRESLSVSTVTSPSAPVKLLCCAVVPRLSFNNLAIM